MALFRWSEEYSVKINEIDNQHKKLVQMINELHTAMSAGKGKEVLGKIIDDLVSYTQFHFSSEEKMMLKHHYPGYLHHQLVHQNFTRKVKNYKLDLHSGKMVISQEILIFLKDWLVKHIMGMDKEYSPYLTNKVVS